MELNFPQINFIYSKIFDESFRKIFDEYKTNHADYYKGFYPSFIKIRQSIEELEKEWQRVSEKIFTSYKNLTGFEINQEKFDCYVVGRNPIFRGISEPLTIVISENSTGRAYSREELAIILAHEIFHKLISSTNDSLWKFFQQEFEKENEIVCRHIPVLALEKEIALNLYGEKFINKFITTYISKGYRRAWEIVNQTGPEIILRRIRTEISKSELF